MKTIFLFEKTGSFAENKDTAREIRLAEILPALKNREEVVLDFQGVETATQSFIHALISDALRIYGSSCLDLLSFKSCTETVKKVVSIVVEYLQESLDSENNPPASD